jgi:type II secretory pathway pseudopilin PulG
MNQTSLLPADRREAGFTLIELLITLTITVAIMTVVLTAVDLNANITRVQSDVSDVQQSTRVAQRDMQRIVRMVGRGGLRREQAIEVIQGEEGTEIDVGGEPVVPETDVLTVRGAFTSPVFRVDASDPTTFVEAGNTATLQIDSVTKSAFDQPLSALHAIYNEDTGATTPEAMLLVGSQGEAVFAVVEVTDIQFNTITLDVQNQSREVERATLTVSINAAAGGNAPYYLTLQSGPPGSTAIPANLNSIAFAAILEEYEFFVREDFAIPGEDTSRPSPKLARARMIPGSPNLLHEDGIIDIADNVFDLQVALGIDVDGNGRIDIEDGGGALLAATDDEWRYNAPGLLDDDDTAWPGSLQHVRLTIVGQAQTADRQYVSPALDDIENRAYSEAATPGSGDELADRRYRRRILQSTIDLRNL